MKMNRKTMNKTKKISNKLFHILMAVTLSLVMIPSGAFVNVGKAFADQNEALILPGMNQDTEEATEPEAEAEVPAPTPAPVTSPSANDDSASLPLGTTNEIVEISNYRELINQISSNPGKEYVLVADLINNTGSSSISITQGMNVVIDLNGHSIDRNSSGPTVNGSLFINQGNLHIKNSGPRDKGIIKGGFSSDHGGSFKCGNLSSTVNLLVENCTIMGNKASRYGGAIYLYDNAQATFNSCVIKDNESLDTTGYGGGAINCDKNSSIELKDSVIINNKAQCYGGGISWRNVNNSEERYLKLKNTQIVNNSIVDSAFTGTLCGGGIYLEDYKNNEFVFENCIVNGNEIERNGEGAGLYIKATNPVLNNCIISENHITQKSGLSQESHGAGLLYWGASNYECKLIINGGIISDNYFDGDTDNCEGVALYSNRYISSININKTKIYKNHSNKASVIYAGGPLTLDKGTEIFGNYSTGEDIGYAVMTDAHTDRAVSLVNAKIYGNNLKGVYVKATSNRTISNGVSVYNNFDGDGELNEAGTLYVKGPESTEKNVVLSGGKLTLTGTPTEGNVVGISSDPETAVDITTADCPDGWEKVLKADNSADGWYVSKSGDASNFKYSLSKYTGAWEALIYALQGDEPSDDLWKNFFDLTGSGSAWDPYVITLKSNIKCLSNAYSDENHLTVGDEADIVLDLNGYKLDRGLTSETAIDGGGYVIKSYGNLTIQDSSGNDSGIITGGHNSYATDEAGGIYCIGGTLNFNGGHIYNCSSGYGGGIYVGNVPYDAKFYMNGGRISNCESSAAGGLYILSYEECEFSGGIIDHNNAIGNDENNINGVGGGIYIASSGRNFSMTGGTVCNNSCRDYGPGILVDGNAKFEEATGKEIKIYGNTCERTQYGCGILFGPINSEADSNVELISGKVYGNDGSGVYIHRIDNTNNSVNQASINPATFKIYDNYLGGSFDEATGCYVSNEWSQPCNLEINNGANYGAYGSIGIIEPEEGVETDNVIGVSTFGNLHDGESYNFVYLRSEGSNLLKYFKADGPSEQISYFEEGGDQGFQISKFSAWTSLQKVLQGENIGDVSSEYFVVNDGTIKLLNDIVCNDQYCGPLRIPDGYEFTIDLNGHMINRNLNESIVDGYVIENRGELTIIDSSPNTIHKFKYHDEEASETYSRWVLDYNGDQTVYGGVITGGFNYIASDGDVTGGGIQNRGTLYLDAGNIVGNGVFSTKFPTYGGGICVGYDANFTMNGGKILGNLATGESGHGGGIYLDVCSNWADRSSINGGEISSNTADGEHARGGAISGNCAFSVQNCLITDNSSTYSGAIDVADEYKGSQWPGIAFILGGTIIKNNRSDYFGGCTYLQENKKSELYFGGNAQIFNNNAGSVKENRGNFPSNICCGKGRTFGFGVGNNAPTIGMRIGVHTSVDTTTSENVISNADLGHQYINYFFLDTIDYGEYLTYTGDDQIAIRNYEGAWEDLNNILAGEDVEGYEWENFFSFEWDYEKDVYNVILKNDIVNLDNDNLGPIIISQNSPNQNIVIDLNGRTLDRGLVQGSAKENGMVIKNEGNLTIRDSSASQTGKITGGYGFDTGNLTSCAGGINSGCENADASLTIESGSITNCSSYAIGGGVLVEGGSFLMKGGTISGCRAGDMGGGIAIIKATSATIEDGIIEGNRTSQFGAGILVYDKEINFESFEISLTLNISGVTVRNNIIHGGLTSGAGICCVASALNLKENTLQNKHIDIYGNENDSPFGAGIGSVCGEVHLYSGSVYSNLGSGMCMFPASAMDLDFPNILTINTDFVIKDNYTDGVINEETGLCEKGDGYETNLYTYKDPNEKIYIEGSQFTQNKIGFYEDLRLLKEQTYPVSFTESCSKNYSNVFVSDKADQGEWISQNSETKQMQVNAYDPWSDLCNLLAKESLVNPTIAQKWFTYYGDMEDENAGLTVVLRNDIKATSLDSALDIGLGKKVTIDLNGYTLDRGLKDVDYSSPQDLGMAIITSGIDLSIIDSSENHKGKITGGNNNDTGGGILIFYGSLYCENITINNCSASAGGGIYVNNDDAVDVHLKNVTFKNNSATESGGGLHFNMENSDSANLTVDNCVFEGNNVGDGYAGADIQTGGGCCLIGPGDASAASASIVFNNTIFKENETKNTNTIGAGMYVEGLPATFNNCEFIDNYSAGECGGCAIYSSSPFPAEINETFNGGSFVGNISESTFSEYDDLYAVGGLAIRENYNVVIDGTEFKDNVGVYVGAISNIVGLLTITGGTSIHDNCCTAFNRQSASGIYSASTNYEGYANRNLSLVNGKVYNNNGDDGVQLWAYDSSFTHAYISRNFEIRNNYDHNGEFHNLCLYGTILDILNDTSNARNQIGVTLRNPWPTSKGVPFANANHEYLKDYFVPDFALNRIDYDSTNKVLIMRNNENFFAARGQSSIDSNLPTDIVTSGAGFGDNSWGNITPLASEVAANGMEIAQMEADAVVSPSGVVAAVQNWFAAAVDSASPFAIYIIIGLALASLAGCGFVLYRHRKNE